MGKKRSSLSEAFGTVQQRTDNDLAAEPEDSDQIQKPETPEMVPGRGGKLIAASTPVNMTFTVTAKERYEWTVELRRRGLSAVSVLRRAMNELLLESKEQNYPAGLTGRRPWLYRFFFGPQDPMIAQDVSIMEGSPNPDIEALKEQVGELNKKIHVLEESMKTQRAQLDGDIRELGAGVRSDIDHLKRLVQGVIIVFLISVAASFIGRLLGYIQRKGKQKGNEVAEETQQIPTYKLGERIQIQLHVHDNSGVAGVVAFFRLKQEPTKSIRLVGSGDGKPDAVVTLDTTITEEIAPGEYVCDWIEMVDIKGNRTVVANPDKDFQFIDMK